MHIEPDDFVKVVDEELSGRIVSCDGISAVLICEDGFEYRYEINQLILIRPDGSSEHQVKSKVFETAEENTMPPKPGPRSKIRFRGPKPSFDLHMEALAPDENFKLKHDALLFQLDFANRVITEAKSKRIRNLVFIHGVGSGKLRAALRNMLGETHPEIEYFDAAYREFGLGATEILIHGLGKA